MTDWQKFVLAHGWQASGYELAAVIGQPVETVQRFRAKVSSSRLAKTKRFAELFALWHGRPPRDDEWPVPRKDGGKRTYEWQAPEFAMLASLVGRLGIKQIAKTLTARLRKVTGDSRARRSLNAIQVGMQRIGMLSSDVVGGITTSQAAREIGSTAIIYQAIEGKRLRPFRVGVRWVIPYDQWAAFKAKRVFSPAGYVRLTMLKRPLSIRSDKLSEWARAGYVPTAIRCNPFGTKGHSTQFGTWWIDAKVARKLIADRRAGRPMPWWGKPEIWNLRVTWSLLQKRLHPSSCRTCAQIWGRKGPPRSFEDYSVQYPPLAHGAKRHLTRPWTPGLSLSGVARYAGVGYSTVWRAIEIGQLDATGKGRRRFVSRTDAALWKSRGCRIGGNDKSWVSVRAARKIYQFSVSELRKFIASGALRTKTGTNGPMRGIVYIPRQQCARLREKIGFTELEAARRAKVSVARLRTLLRGVDWRGAKRIQLATVQAVIKRIYSEQGYTIQRAASRLRVDVTWIHQRIVDGTVRVARAKWDRRRLYITAPMFERLLEAKRKPVKRQHLNSEWFLVSDAALEAGVCSTIMNRWGNEGEIARRRSGTGWRYHRKAVRSRARRYWKTVRSRRGVLPPDWLQDEQRGKSNGKAEDIHYRAPWRRSAARLAHGVRGKRKTGAQSTPSRANTDDARRRTTHQPGRRDPVGLVAPAFS